MSAASTGVFFNHAVDSVTIRGTWFEDMGYCGVFAYGFVSLMTTKLLVFLFVLLHFRNSRSTY